MKTHESQEMYLETILLLRMRKANVRSVDVVEELGYAKSSVSRAVNLLQSNGFIHIDESGDITLTPEGQKKAEDIYAKHRSLGIASNHADVDHWWSRYGVTMDDFRADVARLLEQEDAAQEEEEEPSMTREEITQLVKQDLEEERDARIFRNLADVPDWAAATAQKLVERGALQGDGKALNLSYDLLRTMVALDRLGILDA